MQPKLDNTIKQSDQEENGLVLIKPCTVASTEHSNLVGENRITVESQQSRSIRNRRQAVSPRGLKWKRPFTDFLLKSRMNRYYYQQLLDRFKPDSTVNPWLLNSSDQPIFEKFALGSQKSISHIAASAEDTFVVTKTDNRECQDRTLAVIYNTCKTIQVYKPLRLVLPETFDIESCFKSIGDRVRVEKSFVFLTFDFLALGSKLRYFDPSSLDQSDRDGAMASKGCPVTQKVSIAMTSVNSGKPNEKPPLSSPNDEAVNSPDSWQ